MFATATCSLLNGSSYLSMITHLETLTSLSVKTICNGKSTIYGHFLSLEHSLEFCQTTFLFPRVSRDEHWHFVAKMLRRVIWSRQYSGNFWSAFATSFPGSLIPGGKMRDPGNEVASQTHAFWDDMCFHTETMNLISWRRSRRNPVSRTHAVKCACSDHGQLRTYATRIDCFGCFAPEYFFMAQHTSASNSITFCSWMT